MARNFIYLLALGHLLSVGLIEVASAEPKTEEAPEVPFKNEDHNICSGEWLVTGCVQGVFPDTDKFKMTFGGEDISHLLSADVVSSGQLACKYVPSSSFFSAIAENCEETSNITFTATATNALAQLKPKIDVSAVIIVESSPFSVVSKTHPQLASISPELCPESSCELSHQVEGVETKIDTTKDGSCVDEASPCGYLAVIPGTSQADQSLTLSLGITQKDVAQGIQFDSIKGRVSEKREIDAAFPVSKETADLCADLWQLTGCVTGTTSIVGVNLRMKIDKVKIPDDQLVEISLQESEYELCKAIPLTQLFEAIDNTGSCQQPSNIQIIVINNDYENILTLKLYVTSNRVAKIPSTLNSKVPPQWVSIPCSICSVTACKLQANGHFIHMKEISTQAGGSRTFKDAIDFNVTALCVAEIPKSITGKILTISARPTQTSEDNFIEQTIVRKGDIMGVTQEFDLTEIDLCKEEWRLTGCVDKGVLSSSTMLQSKTGNQEISVSNEKIEVEGNSCASISLDKLIESIEKDECTRPNSAIFTVDANVLEEQNTTTFSLYASSQKVKSFPLSMESKKFPQLVSIPPSLCPEKELCEVKENGVATEIKEINRIGNKVVYVADISQTLDDDDVSITISSKFKKTNKGNSFHSEIIRGNVVAQGNVSEDFPIEVSEMDLCKDVWLVTGCVRGSDHFDFDIKFTIGDQILTSQLEKSTFNENNLYHACATIKLDDLFAAVEASGECRQPSTIKLSITNNSSPTDVTLSLHGSFNKISGPGPFELNSDKYPFLAYIETSKCLRGDCEIKGGEKSLQVMGLIATGSSRKCTKNLKESEISAYVATSSMETARAVETFSFVKKPNPTQIATNLGGTTVSQNQSVTPIDQSQSKKQTSQQQNSQQGNDQPGSSQQGRSGPLSTASSTSTETTTSSTNTYSLVVAASLLTGTTFILL